MDWNNETIVVVIVSTITLILLVIVVLILFYEYNRRKTRLLLEKKHLEQAVLHSKMEIREQILRNIGKELHDNLGQLLSVVKLNLNRINKGNLDESISLVGQCVDEMRSLSKVLDPDSISRMGLIDSLKIEVQRLNRLNLISASLDITGQESDLAPSVEIILFRIMQESISNVLNHAKASTLDILMNFKKNLLNITIEDNGVGFDIEEINNMGSGMSNMMYRAETLNAAVDIISTKGQGTTISINYKIP